MIDPILVGALGSGLVTALTKLVDEGVVEPLAEKGFEPFVNLIARKYDQAKDNEKLRQAFRKALELTLDPIPKDNAVRLWIDTRLTSWQPKAMEIVAAAAIEMYQKDPNVLPAELLSTLNWTTDRVHYLVDFLFHLRRQLAELRGSGYAEGIAYADRLAERGYLAGLTRQMTAMILLQERQLKVEQALLMLHHVTIDETEGFNHYMNFLRQDLQHLPIPMTRVDPDVPCEVDVHTVFVPLYLRDQDGQRSQPQDKGKRRTGSILGDMNAGEEQHALSPLSIGEVLTKTHKFILLGKPGSGKTTLLRRIALALAEGNPQAILGWETPPLLPIYIRLRNFNAFLENNESKYSTASYGALVAYFDHYFREECRINLIPQFFERWLEEGHCFVLMDAFDEVSGRREEVAQIVEAFIHYYAPKGNHFGLASRPRGYETVADQLRRSRLVEFTVSDLTPAGSQELIHKLFVWLESNPVERTKFENGLVQRIFKLGSLELKNLAANPLFCTALVMMYKYRRAELPEREVDILQELVDLLLGFWRNQQASLDERARLAREDGTGTDYKDVRAAVEAKKRRLRHLALEMQQRGKVEIPCQEARSIIEKLLRERDGKDEITAQDWAEKFLENSHDCSGLLVSPAPDIYAFTHDSFREFLAADELRNQSRIFVATVLEHLNNQGWEHVILLAGAHRDLSEDLCQELIQRILFQVSSMNRGSPNWLRHLVMAGRLAFYMGDKLAEPQRQDVIRTLHQVMVDELLKPVVRADAADSLDLLSLPSDLFALVPLPSGGWIGKYPVTNAQYQRFLEAPDFYNEQFWTDFPRFDPPPDFSPLTSSGNEGWKWLQGNWDDDHKLYPRYWNDAQLGITRRGVPVVGVTWYEANAYCKWLQAHWAELPEGQGNPGLPAGTIRLPTEAEWVAAAGGADPEDRFPWDQNGQVTQQSELILRCANVGESGIGRTTPVWMYPLGQSPKEVWDLAGNVWEWQVNFYNRDQDVVSLRGGAWGSNADRARLSYCSYLLPGDLWLFNGLRLFFPPG